MESIGGVAGGLAGEGDGLGDAEDAVEAEPGATEHQALAGGRVMGSAGMIMEEADGGATGQAGDEGGQFPVAGGPALEQVEGKGSAKAEEGEGLAAGTEEGEALIAGEREGGGVGREETGEGGGRAGGEGEIQIQVKGGQAFEEVGEHALGARAIEGFDVDQEDAGPGHGIRRGRVYGRGR
jgi:hypothetical protein